MDGRGFEGRAFRSRVSAGILENAEFEYKGDSEASPDMHINTIPTPIPCDRCWFSRLVRERAHRHTNVLNMPMHIYSKLVRKSSDVYILYPLDEGGWFRRGGHV